MSVTTNIQDEIEQLTDELLELTDHGPLTGARLAKFESGEKKLRSLKQRRRNAERHTSRTAPAPDPEPTPRTRQLRDPYRDAPLTRNFDGDRRAYSKHDVPELRSRALDAVEQSSLNDADAERATQILE